ncbi:MAG: CDP-diacylglycerol--glycerol-3-phosphate 3-phosphatidyltransferase [Treponema sp.]|nr:CDP-diacylglycerol--glycerol-3-phosphate 3-phosphatidyltransferase [Candidatus Treponema equifaecale]
MKLSNKFTLSRALFAPVFYLIYNLPIWTGSQTLSFVSACVLIPLLAIFQLTDYWDGHYARKYGEVSDFGKLFDPFADVILNLTVFICAVGSGYMPMVLFLLILYREFSQSFLRMAASKQGVAIAARKGGKFKTVFYIISGFYYLTIESYIRLGLNFIPENILSGTKVAAVVMFVLCALFSWASFADYIKSFYSVAKKE